jgi:hypothetical protein
MQDSVIESPAESSLVLNVEVQFMPHSEIASPPEKNAVISDTTQAPPDDAVQLCTVLTCVPPNDPLHQASIADSSEVVPSKEVASTQLALASIQEKLEPSSADLTCETKCVPSSEDSLLSLVPELNSSALSPKEPSLSSSDTIQPGTSPKASLRLSGICATGHKKCEYGNGCTVQPSFNYPGEMGGMFCGCHRLEGMVNVVNKMCEFPGCHKRPSLNYPGVRPAIRCGEHKLPGMTNSFRKLETSILIGELKEKAEELKKRPKKRGDMIKVQRHFIKEKIFSAVINEELSREIQSESNISTSPPSNTQASAPKLAPAIASSSKPNPVIVAPRSFAAPQSTSNLANMSNLANIAYVTPYQTSNVTLQTGSVPLQSITYPGANHLFSTPDFATAYSANLNLFSGDYQTMKNFGIGASGYLPGIFPGIHEVNPFQFDQYSHFNQISNGFHQRFQDGRPSLYSNAIPHVSGCMPPPNVAKEGGEDVDLSIFASIASSMSQGSASSFSKRQKIEEGKGKIAELLSRTTEEKSGGAFATVAGRSFRPIMGRATSMTFPKC